MPVTHGGTAAWFVTKLLPPTLFAGCIASLDEIPERCFASGTAPHLARWSAQIGEGEEAFHRRIREELHRPDTAGGGKMVYVYAAGNYWAHKGYATAPAPATPDRQE